MLATMAMIRWHYGVGKPRRAGWGGPVGRAAWRLRRWRISSWERYPEAQSLAHLDTSATEAEQTNRNVGFVRQAGEESGAGGAPRDKTPTISAEELLSVKEGHERHEQLFALIAGLIDLLRRHRVRRQGDAVRPSNHFELFEHPVSLVIQYQRRRAVLGKEQAIVVLSQVLASRGADEHPNVRRLVRFIARSWHRSAQCKWTFSPLVGSKRLPFCQFPRWNSRPSALTVSGHRSIAKHASGALPCG